MKRIGMTNTNLLKAEIIKSGLSRKEIAELLGISLNSTNKKINNQVEFKASEIFKITSALHISDKDAIFFASNVDSK